MTVTTASAIWLAQRDQWKKPSSNPLLWGCQGLLPGLPPGTRTLEPCRVCTARTKVKAVLWEELPQLCASWEGDGPLWSAGLWPSCSSLSALLLTGQGSSCWPWLHSHLVILPGIPPFCLPRPALSSFPPEAPWRRVRGFVQTLEGQPGGTHLQTWKISFLHSA